MGSVVHRGNRAASIARWAATAAVLCMTSGPAGAWQLDTLLASADASFLAEADDNEAGWITTGVGDVDGDGAADLLFGAHHNADAGADAGKAYLVMGEVACQDGDGDGYGAPGHASCAQGDDTDCDDTDPDVNPDADEICDGLDDDCDGEVDENDALDAETWFDDNDGDGFTSCGGPESEPDCDDGDPAVFPGAEELCDGVDGDCDGGLPWDEQDADGDGWMPCDGDCDDGDPALTPEDGDGDGVSTCNGDCDDTDPGANPDDVDGDGWSTCDEPPDCNDVNSSVSPGHEEDCLNEQDDNCDGLVDGEDPACAGDDDDDDVTVADDDSGGEDPQGTESCECGIAGSRWPTPWIVGVLAVLLGRRFRLRTLRLH